MRAWWPISRTSGAFARPFPALRRARVRGAALCLRRSRADRLQAFRDLHVQQRHDDAQRHCGRERHRLQLRRGAGSSIDRDLARGIRPAVRRHGPVGPSNVELAAKYRFLHQDGFGLDVSVFPRVFLPSGSNVIGDNHASLLLPIWVQKDWNGGWSAFGGGGCTVSEFRAVDFCQAGAVLNYQLLPKLQIGAELFHQTADTRHAGDDKPRHRMALRPER